MLSLPSQVLFRNEDFLEAERILVINFTQDGFIEQLKQLNPNSKITAFTSNYANGAALSNGQCDLVIDAQLPQQPYDLIILYYPKAKAEALMLLDNIRAIADTDTRLLVVGENKGGVRSVPKQLKALCTANRKVDSARHCSLFQFIGLTPLQAFDLANYQTQFDIKVNDITLTLVTLPGVFSHGELDKGTELLLNNVELNQPEKILDFACGCGVISAYYGKKHPSMNITASDVSALALAATKLTLKENGLSADCILADGISSINKKFDHIISNPPFHTGLKTDYEITQSFIADAKKALTKGGELNIVANAFLPYPKVLSQEFEQYTMPVNNRSFAIYHAKA